MPLSTIIQQTAGGSNLLSALLWTAVFLHIGGGGVAILAGAGAVTVRKGEQLHRWFGAVFVAAMMTMAGAAVFVALLVPEQPNVLAGAFAFYLVLSAWLTVRRKDGRVGRAERWALVLAACTSASGLIFGVQATIARTHGAPQPAVFFVFAFIAALAAVLDLKLILRGGISGAARIARHAWRMCVGLFIATGSFFLGQQKVMPVWIQGSAVLIVLGVAPLVLMIFWLIRIRFSSAYSRSAPEGKSPALQLSPGTMALDS